MYKYKLSLLIIFVLCKSVHSEIKGSLAFVIDNTYSMTDEINQVKEKTNYILDVIYSKNNIKIKNLVLVTFNDPDAVLQVQTEDRDTFKNKLKNISVTGGKDCPEYAMTGILYAINASLPNSFIYVYTDASAKDYYLYEDIKKKALEKFIQITFLLTGICKKADENSRTYQVYEKLAVDTTGDIFNVQKHDIAAIMIHIMAKVVDNKISIYKEKIPAGITKTFDFTVDNFMKSIRLTLNCMKAKMYIADSHNQKIDTKTVDVADSLQTITMESPKPDKYTVVISADEEARFTIEYFTDFIFEYGFSKDKPDSLRDTLQSPIAGEQFYLSIDLPDLYSNTEVENVVLLNIEGVQAMKLLIKLINKNNNYYITEPFQVPNQAFKIQVNGYDLTKKENITRVSQTAILPNEKKRAPTIELEIIPEVNSDRVRLKCKVNAYPRANIMWLNKFGYEMYAQINDTTGVLEILKTRTEYSKYTCKASNTEGTISNFFASPKINKTKTKTVKMIGDQLDLVCSVQDSCIPSPEIVWYHKKNITDSYKVLLTGTREIKIPTTGINDAGIYKCTAANMIGIDIYEIDVSVKEHPMMLKMQLKILKRKDVSSPLYLICTVHAYPKPNIKWLDKYGNILLSNEITDYNTPNSYSSKLEILESNNNNYSCVASNSFGKTATFASYPELHKDKLDIVKRKGDELWLLCRVQDNCYPKPIITWYYKKNLNDQYKIINKMYIIHKNNVTSEDAGIYKCEAENDIGVDILEQNVYIKWPPGFKDLPLESEIYSKVGDIVYLNCDVDGFPYPNINWYFNDKKLSENWKYHIYKNNTIRLKVNMEDGGTFKCEAFNDVGRENILFHINIYVPVYIHPPNETVLNINGDNEKAILLECYADGQPKPKFKWSYLVSMESKIILTVLKTGAENTLTLPNENLKEGYYVCEATNSMSSDRLTFTVRKHGPPWIVNERKSLKINALDGDPVLRVPCKAYGNPKPEISWFVNGNEVPIGKYYYKEDNDLIIVGLNNNSSGIYKCLAVNSIGNATQAYEVNVTSLNIAEIENLVGSKIVYIKNKQHSELSCDIPHNITDYVRWFKNYSPVKDSNNDGKLYVSGIESDTDIYICRVINNKGSRNYILQVIIGDKPRFFERQGYKEVDLIPGRPTFLDCASLGLPPPKTTWYVDDKIIEGPLSSESLKLVEIEGNYTCKVSNEFGSISRTYIAKLEGCQLSVKYNFNKDQPLFLTKQKNIPSFPQSNGFVKLLKDQNIVLHCDENDITYQGECIGLKPEGLPVSCAKQTNFLIKSLNNEIYKITDFKCSKSLKTTEMHNQIICTRMRNSLYRIGYKVSTSFLIIFDICPNIKTKIPKYTRHAINSGMSNYEPNHDYKNNTIFDYTSFYNCKMQRKQMSPVGTQSWAPECCFIRRHLVSPRDLFPGLPQLAAFDYHNVVPHWNFCEKTNNWDEIESRIRMLVKSLGYVIVWTGTHETLDKFIYKGNEIKVSNGQDKKYISISKYIWKVVENHYSQSALAIVQLNIPFLPLHEAKSHVLCEDICDEIEWLGDINWADVNNGYIFCCSIENFQKAFNYKGLFQYTAIFRKMPPGS